MDARDFFSWDLDDFDLDLVGFDCAGDIEWWELKEPWRCRFRPGCGATNGADCPLMRQRAQVLRAPKRPQ